jgi:hypothetical protein
MKKLALPLALAILSSLSISAQSPSKNIHEQVDPYSNLRTLFLEVSTRNCPGDPSLGPHDAEVYLLLSATEDKNHQVHYFLTPELDHGSNTLNVRKNGTMNVLINGIPSLLNDSLGSTVVTNYADGRSYLHETVPFAVDVNQLDELSKTDLLQFRINGSRQSIQRCTDAKHLRDVAEFLDAAAQYGLPMDPNPTQIPQPAGNDVATAAQFKTLSTDNIETSTCSGQPMPGPQDPSVQLTVIAEQRPDRTVRYFIVTDLAHGAPLGLHSKDTLETLIDGVNQTFHTPHGSAVETITGPDGKSFAHETIAFHVDRRDLIALSKTSTFQFRIDGPRQTIQRCTDANHLQKLADFVNATASLYDHPVALASASH